MCIFCERCRGCLANLARRRRSSNASNSQPCLPSLFGLSTPGALLSHVCARNDKSESNSAITPSQPERVNAASVKQFRAPFGWGACLRPSLYLAQCEPHQGSNYDRELMFANARWKRRGRWQESICLNIAGPKCVNITRSIFLRQLRSLPFKWIGAFNQWNVKWVYCISMEEKTPLRNIVMCNLALGQ